MIVGAALCPHPPLLLAELTGAQDVGADLRRDCLAAVTTVLETGPDEVVVVGGARGSGTPPRDAVLDVPAFGGPGPRLDPVVPRLPLSLGLGTRLLDDAAWSGHRELRSVAWDAAPRQCRQLGRELASRPGRTALLVMGDGSARRSVKAPGYLDPRAAPFDTGVTQAVAAGDAAALARLDPVLAAELLVAGRAPWQVLAGAVGAAEVQARTVRVEDPFGVLYVVATWLSGRGAVSPTPTPARPSAGAPGP